LRHLPVETVDQPLVSRAWRPRNGFVAAFVALAVILAATAGAVWLTEPKVAQIDLTNMHQNVQQRIDQMTPAEWWDMWTYRYRPEVERGFTVYESRMSPAQLQEQTKKRLIEKALLIVAAIAAAVAGIAALWPAGQTRRR
jgi:hypothetical protein